MRNSSLPPWWKKETYSSNSEQTMEDSIFEPVNPEEEDYQATKYSFQNLSRKIRLASRKMKFEKIIK